MSDAREALVALLHNEGDGGIWEHFDRKNSETVADAILAAGWTPPGERVKPSVEDVARQQHYCPVHGDLLSGRRSLRCAEAPQGHEFLATTLPPVEDVARRVDEALRPHQVDPSQGPSDAAQDVTRAVLALLPGRTEREVKAEAWDEWHSCEYPREDDHARFCLNPYRKEADRG